MISSTRFTTSSVLESMTSTATKSNSSLHLVTPPHDGDGLDVQVPRILDHLPPQHAACKVQPNTAECGNEASRGV